jgi:ABC-type sugar transport system, permease component
MSKFQTKTVGVLTAMDLKRKPTRILYWSIFSLMVVIGVICLFPPLWLFLSSLKSIQEFYSVRPTLIPHTWEFHKFIDVWQQLQFLTYYFNSAKLAIGEIAFSLIFNSLFGYVLSQLKPKGTSFLMALLLWTLLLPNTINIVPVYMNIINFPFLHINLSNSFLPMWFMAGSNAFYTLIFKSFFDSIPYSYTEAAILDGCSPLQIFMKIMLPLSKPVLYVITIFTMTNSWSEFFWPYLVLTKKSFYTVMIRLFTMTNSGGSGYGISVDYQMLAIVYSIIPPIVVFFLLQKHIMKGGLTLGGIKG